MVYFNVIAYASPVFMNVTGTCPGPAGRKVARRHNQKTGLF